MTYVNTGDWVENCTALVEYQDGELVLESFYPNRPALSVSGCPVTSLSPDEATSVNEPFVPALVGEPVRVA